MDYTVVEVKLARKGNKKAFVKLIKASEISMYRVAKGMVKTDSDCADAIQEAILKAYESINTLRKAEYFKTWIIRILINECHKILKQKKTTIPMETMKETSLYSSIQKRLEINEAIEALDDELRIIVTLYYLEDLPLKEIAILLTIPEGTAKSRLSRARDKLQSLLGNNERGHLHYE